MAEHGRGCGDGGCRDTIDAAIRTLKEDFDEKHEQNQGDIRNLRTGQDGLKDELSKLKGRMEPFLDNGQPGLFSKMSDKLDAVLKELSSQKVALGVEQGRRDVWSLLRAAIGPLIVGLLMLWAQHSWK